jgi:hypothetical protein
MHRMAFPEKGQYSSLDRIFLGILYFVDRASRYNSLLMINLTHFFFYISLFITPLYMFRASSAHHQEVELH